MGLAAAGIMLGLSEPGHVQALVYTPLPLVLWAAVRFGSLGVSVSLLATTLCMTFGATRHLGSLAGPSESAHDFAIQFFMVMIVTAVSLLFLAAVLRERERAEATLRERLTFEALLSEVSARFARRPADGRCRRGAGRPGPHRRVPRRRSRDARTALGRRPHARGPVCPVPRRGRAAPGGNPGGRVPVGAGAESPGRSDLLLAPGRPARRASVDRRAIAATASGRWWSFR